MKKIVVLEIEYNEEPGETNEDLKRFLGGSNEGVINDSTLTHVFDTGFLKILDANKVVLENFLKNNGKIIPNETVVARRYVDTYQIPLKCNKCGFKDRTNTIRDLLAARRFPYCASCGATDVRWIFEVSLIPIKNDPPMGWEYWDEHENFLIRDWVGDINFNRTRVSYWEWVNKQLGN